VTADAPGSGTPTGTVTFLDGSTDVATVVLNASGAATFAMSDLMAGPHVITADYAGDMNHQGSSGSVPQTVNQADTGTMLNSGPNPSRPGQLITFTATVTPSASGPAPPSGTATFLDGSVEIGTGALDATGTATFATSELAAGDHLITVDYGGDSNFKGSSGSAPQTVIQADTTTVLTSAPNPSTFGQLVTFTATVTPSASGPAPPTGAVTFLDGLTEIGTGTLDASGIATLVTSTLTAGDHLITADYAGDGNYKVCVRSSTLLTRLAA
jgi:hypothetical protein